MRTTTEIAAEQAEVVLDIDAGSRLLQALIRENQEIKDRLRESRNGIGVMSKPQLDIARARLDEVQEGIGDTRRQLSDLYRAKELLHVEWKISKTAEFEAAPRPRPVRPATPFERAFVEQAGLYLSPADFTEIKRLTLSSLKSAI